MDLIRKMLIAMEDSPSGWAPRPLQIEEYGEETIGYHAYLLVDAGLAKGTDTTSSHCRAPRFDLHTLTWAGHEFCQAAREDTRWNKAKDMVKEKGGAITFEILKELLASLMRGQFGLG